ncbi:nucleotide-binding protein [Frigidibacter sp.]|uniref:nucleotide-binding protein n=1 Tax=Frigidibacter sp. TaxID=2586418 RepID=UPI002734AB6C|nr:nucleotide-binding protein [Frigidibacter sp.]MDP3340774.1 nucleotide-binding protein [Frigidibacter sp.]
MIASQGLFRQINNTLLDLQQSDLQSYPAQVKRLGRLLQNEELQPFNSALTEKVNLDEFIASSERTQGGMVGSAELVWPEDDKQILGLRLLLIVKFSENPEYMAEFGYTFFWTGSKKIMSGVHAVISQIIIPFFRDFKDYVEGDGRLNPTLILPMSNKVFIVHGHDGEAREAVARFLSNLGFEPVILNEQANQGRTIIEKVEANADVGFAVVLLTPDDFGRAKSADDLEPRARQNVLLELGYFMAKLGRDKVCALRRGEVSIPSDFAGVVWEEMDVAGGWRQKLGRELQAAGHPVDWNKLMR